MAMVRFKSGGLGSIVTSVSQKPGLYTKVHVHGSNGASVGVETDRGATFIAGVSEVAEPPLNDLWTIPGEEHLLAGFQAEDQALRGRARSTVVYHARQIQDFLEAVLEDRPPAGHRRGRPRRRRDVHAIYRSQRDGRPVRLPLAPELDRDDMDGRLAAP